MRRSLAAPALFALALFVAACGGGGKSGVVPAGPNALATASTAPASKARQATMSFYVPPANKQNARAKPLYISSATQAFAVYVAPYPSAVPTGFPSPIPSGIAIFPVTTPSPCAAASGGGETCTLTVTAPIGTDLFIVVALPTATINPNVNPLSAFISGPVSVGATPAASPLSFTLNGVVNSAAIAVASADPQNTPNTQVFTVLQATSAPLAITAYDSNGNVVMSSASQPFFIPIAIAASPASDGVTLSLTGSSPCGSTASGAAATIACAGDLGNLRVAYDGSTHPDSQDHAIDTFDIVAAAQPNPSPSPATIVLQSNVVAYPVASPGYVYDGLTQRLSSGALLYEYSNDENAFIGTFSPSTATATAPVELNGVAEPYAMAVDGNGQFFIDDDGDYFDCWSSVNEALSGAAPDGQLAAPKDPAGGVLFASTMTVDGANNVWMAGYDVDVGQAYATYFTVSSCAFTLSGNYYLLYGDVNYDSSPFSAPLSSGMAFNSFNAGLYEVTTTTPTSSPGVSPLVPALGENSYAGGVALDPAANVYAAYTNGSTGDFERVASGSLTSELALLPTSGLDDVYPDPYGLTVFSSTGGPADRASYVDVGVEALGLIEDLPSSPTTFLAALPNVFTPYQTAYNTNGGVYVLYSSEVPGNSGEEGVAIARAVTTKTWSVPVSSAISQGSCFPPIVSINERDQDSGPFTIVASPAPEVSIQAMPGTDHDYIVYPEETDLETVQLTIADKNGRTQVLPSFTVYYEGC
ncbi:MAG TPA: hypothetical protein VMA98_11910 [Candidatus Acidoferrales bacterium]|nr:hypothetical protein [Candidatus Acidoferrales bacterium]